MSYLLELQKLNLTDEEMATFTGVLLLCPQRAGLSDSERVLALYRALVDAFRTSVCYYYLFYHILLALSTKK